MRPRNVHLLMLALIAGYPVVAGIINIIVGLRAHSEFSGINMAVGIVFTGAGVMYVAVSSLVVWQAGTTVRRVLIVHGAVIAGVVALWAMWFLRRVV